MNSALKPALPTASVGATAAAGGQASPAKATAAGPNHAAAHPHSGHNSHNNLVGQNLVQHPPGVPPHLHHAVPSMAPISANMAQMAQNMSHHGNLSHTPGNSVAPPTLVMAPPRAATPSKPTGAPLSLVQDKLPATPSSTQPLALTRTPEKKEGDANGQTNGTEVSPKPAANAPAEMKPQNAEPSKDKADIAKTPGTAPSLPEKASPSTPQKADVPSAVNQPDGPEQPKVATASEPPEKSPAKPVELKTIPAADVAPSQSDSKPESAKDSQEKPVPAPSPAKEAPKVDAAKPEPAKPEPAKSEPAKLEPAKSEPAKPEPAKSELAKPEPAKPEEKKPETVVSKPAASKSTDEKKEPTTDAVDGPKKLEKVVQKAEVKAVEKKPSESPKVAPKVETKAAAKSTIKLATVNTPIRKRRQTSPSKADGATPAKKVAESISTPDSRTKRNRTQVQPYQSPTPELAMATKLSASAAGRATPPKQIDDKLIVFYKNEYLALRNAEGGFYVCQALQNVYRTTHKIKIRWLSQDMATDPSGETYKPDFYDVIDMETVLTTLSLTRAQSGGGSQILKAAEENRVKSILERALKAEKGDKPATTELTEEHPDGLDLSLYKDESQLEKKSRKRKAAKESPRKSDADSSSSATPTKKATPKRSPRGQKSPAILPTKPTTTPPIANKRKVSNSAGSTPITAAPSKTAVQDATPKSAKATPKKTPAKPVKVATPKVDTTPKTGRRSGKVEAKLTPIVPTPSTSTGKATRTPRKPPAKK